MLIQFTVGNYKSFKDTITLSMVASSRKEHMDSNTFTINNKKLKLLKSAVVYGANASGKSNLFAGMRFFKRFIMTSSKESQATEKIRVDNFKLSTETENDPSTFEIIFLHEEVKYRYGFQVTSTDVCREWLFYLP